MANAIAAMKQALGSGARPTKYRINFSVPTAVPTTSNLADVDTLCKAATFPSSELGVIDVYNQGRKLPLPGDTTYTNSWTLTFYQTEDHNIRKDMISWMTSADNFQKNSHSGNPTALLGELSIEQLDSAGNPTVQYTFHNVFVREVGEVTVGDDQIDTLMEFDVTFSFSDWVVGNGEVNEIASGNASTNNDIA